MTELCLLFFPLLSLLMAQMVKNLPVMQETQVRSLGWKDPVEKGMATHSSILGCGGPQSMGYKESDPKTTFTSLELVKWAFNTYHWNCSSPSQQECLPKPEVSFLTLLTFEQCWTHRTPPLSTLLLFLLFALSYSLSLLSSHFPNL